ncbi:MAG: DUF1697 domain-containing protein [Acidobacteriaceae bacterium]|nr:DUF1697 domain-containing protein [Acidobacteriaceae bacterium]MBV9779310.1 DUF1697 domain-containing protein [Acidobacteriaceae bacterium]
MSLKKTSSGALTRVALLRGINLAGRNRLPMKGLIEIFGAAGCTDVSTYIQSGNVLFNAPAALIKRLPEVITEQIAARFGCRVPVILRTSNQIARIISENPFLKMGKPESTLHVYFLANEPDASTVRSLDPDRSPPDAFRVLNREIYLHLPNGMGRTKLSNVYFDAKLATTSTARNWATVLKLYELMQP